MLIKSYLDQNYLLIKYKCLQENKLFEDPKFPAYATSLTRTNSKKFDNIFWKRPHEIVKNPKFIVNKIEPCDFDQGRLGDCWFISAAISISSVSEYMNKIIPKDQSFNQEEYIGIFHFRFWYHGEWIDVCIDDRLPVDENDNLIYCHNKKCKNEMFAPLLEKAYAKLFTCYEFLIGGDFKDALVDLTGGVDETFSIKDLKSSRDEQSICPDVDYFWEIIFKSFRMKSLGGAIIKFNSNKNKDKIKNCRLSIGHSYCILEPIEILFSNNEYSTLRQSIENNHKSSGKPSIKLLKMKNPWGEHKSWTGRWSRFTNDWQRISKDLNKKFNFTDQTHGIFYMSFEDFLEYFDELFLVHTNLNAYHRSTDDYYLNKIKWLSVNFSGEWDEKTSGGCGNECREDFWNNPKYLIKPKTFENRNINLVISLMQKEQVRKRLETDGTFENSNEPIAFYVYKIKDSSQILFCNQFDLSNIRFNDDLVVKVFSSGTYLYRRELTRFISLNSDACYLIVPSIFDKDVTMKYLLRIYFSVESNSDLPIKIIDLNNRNTESFIDESNLRIFLSNAEETTENKSVSDVKTNDEVDDDDEEEDEADDENEEYENEEEQDDDDETDDEEEEEEDEDEDNEDDAEDDETESSDTREENEFSSTQTDSSNSIESANYKDMPLLSKLNLNSNSMIYMVPEKNNQLKTDRSLTNRSVRGIKNRTIPANSNVSNTCTVL